MATSGASAIWSNQRGNLYVICEEVGKEKEPSLTTAERAGSSSFFMFLFHGVRTMAKQLKHLYAFVYVHTADVTDVMTH